MLICSKCKLSKEDVEFPWRNKAHTKRRTECHACKKEYVRKRNNIPEVRVIKCQRERERYHSNIESERERCKIKSRKYARRSKNYRYQVKYNLSINDVESMIKTQNSQCAICRTPSNDLCVDHDHATGKVRAMLCRKCNLVLGLINENPTIIGSVIEYLNHHGA